MITVTCSCTICTQNASRLGKTLPLAATAPDAFLANLRTKAGRIPAKSAHSVVYIAHDPSRITGEAMRRTSGITAL